MAVTEPSRVRLRGLSEIEIPVGRVISAYLDLDPATFAIQPARDSAIRSLVDELGRRIDALEGDVSHDELTGLREDRDRIESFLTNDLDADGVHGVAIFACGPSGLWEVLRLPHAVDLEVAIDAAPRLEPLTRDSDAGAWAVVLVSRSHGRVLRGSTHRLVETLERNDDVHGQHTQGGWSQARYQRSVDREADSHVDALLETLHQAYRRRRFDHLLFVTHDELWPAIERSLHPELAPLVVGRVEAEIEYASPDDVLQTARPEMERVEIERERELFARLAQGLGTGGRGAAGLQPTLDALLQARVETLLLLAGFSAPGTVCPRCGWMGADPEATRCPVDGEAVRRREDVVEAAIAATLQQDASVLVVPRRDDPADPDTGPSSCFLELEGHGGIAAVLRF
jgi:peptide chain release factor subunit 1